jgi:hypothetical protein
VPGEKIRLTTEEEEEKARKSVEKWVHVGIQDTAEIARKS